MHMHSSKLDCLFSAMETLLLHADVVHFHYSLPLPPQFSRTLNLFVKVSTLTTDQATNYRNAHKSHVALQITARRANFAQLAPTDQARQKMAAFNIRYPYEYPYYLHGLPIESMELR